MRKQWYVRGITLMFVLIAEMQLVQPETPQVVAGKKPPAWKNPRLNSRVAAVLERACADCHSNETPWPWYARISPASWLMASHVRRGRAQLNLSYSWSIDDNEKGEIADAVAAGTMPPPSYLWLQPEAKLSMRSES
jgi:hypothetical protein